MTISRKDLQAYYKSLHDELTERYYRDPGNFPGGKEAFTLAHAQIWHALDQEMIAQGWQAPRPDPQPSLADRIARLEKAVFNE